MCLVYRKGVISTTPDKWIDATPEAFTRTGYILTTVITRNHTVARNQTADNPAKGLPMPLSAFFMLQLFHQLYGFFAVVMLMRETVTAAITAIIS